MELNQKTGALSALHICAPDRARDSLGTGLATRWSELRDAAARLQASRFGCKAIKALSASHTAKHGARHRSRDGWGRPKIAVLL